MGSLLVVVCATPSKSPRAERSALSGRCQGAHSAEKRGRPLWGGFTARLHGRQLHHGDLDADWAAVFKQRRPQRAGADHWWHGWQMGDRGWTVASSCRPTTDRTAPLSTPSPALALLPWARRPTRLSNSAELALTSSRPRPMGCVRLHMRGARLRRQGANLPSHSHSRLASITAAVGNTQAGDSFFLLESMEGDSHGWVKGLLQGKRTMRDESPIDASTWGDVGEGARAPRQPPSFHGFRRRPQLGVHSRPLCPLSALFEPVSREYARAPALSPHVPLTTGLLS